MKLTKNFIFIFFYLASNMNKIKEEQENPNGIFLHIGGAILPSGGSTMNRIGRLSC